MSACARCGVEITASLCSSCGAHSIGSMIFEPSKIEPPAPVDHPGFALGQARVFVTSNSAPLAGASASGGALPHVAGPSLIAQLAALLRVDVARIQAVLARLPWPDPARIQALAGAPSRAVRALLLMPSAYAEVARDRTLATEAWLLLAARLAIQSLGWSLLSRDWWDRIGRAVTGSDAMARIAPLPSLVRDLTWAPIGHLFAFLAAAAVSARFLEARGMPVSRARILRVLIYAQLMLVFSGLPVLGWAFEAWCLVASVLALQAATGCSTFEAASAALAGRIASWTVPLVTGLMFWLLVKSI